MTAAEFARKHGIPYQDVRQALPMTPTRRKESWALEFPEDELRQALLKLMAKEAEEQMASGMSCGPEGCKLR